jgi:hypothetical protein
MNGPGEQTAGSHVAAEAATAATAAEEPYRAVITRHQSCVAVPFISLHLADSRWLSLREELVLPQLCRARALPASNCCLIGCPLLLTTTARILLPLLLTPDVLHAAGTAAA